MKRLLSILLAVGLSVGIEQSVMAQQAPNSAKSLMTKPASTSTSVNPGDRPVHRIGATHLAVVTPRSSQNLCNQFADVCLSVQGQPLVPYFNNTLRAPLVGNDGFNAGLMGSSPSYILYPYFSRELFPVDGPGPAGIRDMIGLYVQVSTP
jgi:hypothetical protein